MFAHPDTSFVNRLLNDPDSNEFDVIGNELIRLKAIEQAAYDLVNAIETQEYKRTDYEQLKELIQYG